MRYLGDCLVEAAPGEAVDEAGFYALLRDGYEHRWELPGNYPVFTAVMVIYHYVERIWRILVTPVFLYKIYDH